MRITDGIDARIGVLDIETMKELFYVGVFNPDENRVFGFEVSRRKNELGMFVKWYRENSVDYTVTYNGLNFDCPVLEYIMEKWEEWVLLDVQEVIDRIYGFAQKTIDDRNYGIITYREHQFTVPTFDVFEILGLSNAARMTSLKKCEFALQLPELETMPIPHDKAGMGDDEIQQVIDYCHVDLRATAAVFQLTLGEYPHPLYQGNNQIALRFDILKEFGIPCLNYSDIKIGEELVKKSYGDAIKGEVPRKGFFRKEIKLKYCIPKYVEYKTDQLKNLLKDLKGRVLKQTDGIDEKFAFYGTTYQLAKGGLHSCNSNEVYRETETHSVITADVASMYPATIVNNSYYPYHLGIALLKVYKTVYEKRVELKPQAKKDKRIKGIVDAFKLILNVVFGKLGSMESWLFDMQTLLSVTITGQLSLLMLIEKLEMNGFHVVVANTKRFGVVKPL